jgi:hypothetical protein
MTKTSTRTSTFAMRCVVGSFVVLAGLAVGARRGAANAPAGRYMITNGGTATGTVLDTVTGLTWQQMVGAGGYAQNAAITYCSNNMPGLPGTGWRLPNVRELQSIVDESQTMVPAIDSSAFPGTPDNDYWTSSAYAPTSGQAWYVAFGDGVAYGDIVSLNKGVRCVH